MGDISRVVGGSTPTTTDPSNFNGDVPWITPADLSGYRAKFISRGARNISETALVSSGARLMPAGTVLFSSRAPIGYVAIASNPVSTNQGFKSFVPTALVTSDYLYYYLQRAKPLAVELASGTTFQEISGKNAAIIPVPIPPIAEQREIVDQIEEQFSRLDAGVAALKRAQANLKRYRASVLKAACEGRLVPTEADLARKEGRDYETGEQLLTRILEARRRSWSGKSKYKEPNPPRNNDRPTLPTGWTWASVEQLSPKVVDGTHFKPNYVNSGIAFISVKDVRDGQVNFDDCKFISLDDHKDLIKRCNPEVNDILITKSGTIGRMATVQTARPFSLFVSVALVKTLAESYNVSFFQLALQHYIAGINISQDVKGGLLKNLHLEDLRIVAVVVPPLADQDRIIAEVERRLSIVNQLEATITANLRRATRLRQSILQKAFAGDDSSLRGGTGHTATLGNEK